MKAAKASRWERRPDARTNELLESALHAFARQGYGKARLDEIAEAAGVTKGTIYHYFDTKEALLLGVIDHFHALAFSRAEQALRDRTLPASERIRVMMRTLFSGDEQRRRELLGLMIRGAAHDVRRLHDRWLYEGPVRLWKLVATLVDEGRKSGEFRWEADAEVAARLFVSGLLLQLMWQQHGETVPDLIVDPDRLRETGVDLFLAALRR